MNKTLETADNIINGSREQQYGNPENSFIKIANLWQVYLNNIGCYVPLTSVDVANMMILLKLAREGYKHKSDNYVDICGYAALANTIYDEQDASEALSKADC